VVWVGDTMGDGVLGGAHNESAITDEERARPLGLTEGSAELVHDLAGTSYELARILGRHCFAFLLGAVLKPLREVRHSAQVGQQDVAAGEASARSTSAAKITDATIANTEPTPPAPWPSPPSDSPESWGTSSR